MLKASPFIPLDLHFSVIKCHCRTYDDNIVRHGILELFYWANTIVDFFKHIFKHLKGPQSGLFFITDKCRTEEISGGAFSTGLFEAKFPVSIDYLGLGLSVETIAPKTKK